MRSLRNLSILVARQLTDDAPLFLGVFAATAVSLLMVCLVAFLYPWPQILHVSILLFLLPSFIAVAFVIFGVAQVRGDDGRGISVMLSELPVTSAQLTLARVIAGLMCVTATTTCLGMAVAIAIAAGLISWPPTLFPRGIVDLSAGTLLIGGSCYCLGLSAARRLGGFIRPLAFVFSALLLISIPVVKGLGMPLVIVLAPLLGVLLACQFAPGNYSFPSRMLMGFVVLMMIVIALFWLRQMGHPLLPQGIFHRSDAGSVSYFVSMLVVREFAIPLIIVSAGFWGAKLVHRFTCGDYPRFSHKWIRFAALLMTVVSLLWLCQITRTLRSEAKYQAASNRTIGSRALLDPLGEQDPNSTSFTVFVSVSPSALQTWNDDVDSLQPAGAIMDIMEHREARRYRHRVFCRHFPGYSGFRFDSRRRLFVRTAGSGALYAGPDGVSTAPEGSIGGFHSPIVCWASQQGLIVFDPPSRRFYVVHANSDEIRAGPPVPDGTFRPVDVISPRLHMRTGFVRGYHAAIYGGLLGTDDSGGVYVPVVEQSGSVSILDVRSLTLYRGAGCLPCPYTLFGRGSCRPRDLLDWQARAIFMPARGTYAGLAVASLSRRDARATIAIFDKDGRPVEAGYSAPFSPWLLPVAYVIESLHPPILTLASFFTAYSFEAGATHRALFLMPNSFVALQRDRETSGFFQFLWALLFLVPAVVFSGFLSWRVVRDLAMIGETRRARGVWLAATLAFGLPAYITYRLTRPKVVMKPCANCGCARRIDRDLCHHCGRGWEAPELDPPAWRVTDRVAEQGV